MPQPEIPRVYLVDDEPLAIKRLARLLRESGRVEILGEECDPINALNFLNSAEGNIDAVFLDIQMPALNGFELLAKLDWQPFIIFTTAYNEYALQAFDVNSIDYLLKPIESEQLARAIGRIEKLAEKKMYRNWQEVAEQLASVVRTQNKNYLMRVASRLGERIKFIDLDRISHFFAQDKLTYAATTEGNFIIDRTISDLENDLDPQKFVRIHRAFLVNTEFIEEAFTWFGGRIVVRLKDKERTELTVARDRVRELKEKLGF